MTTGPSPARSRSWARSIARYTASGSIPSTRQAGMPKPIARPDSRGSPVASSTVVETA